MSGAEEADSGRRVRRWRSVVEKREIVQATRERGASVAEVARAHGVNANQVFAWRRALERGELSEPCSGLLPVTVSAPSGPAQESHAGASEERRPGGGAIHIELAGRANISIESGADAAMVRQILESLRK